MIIEQSFMELLAVKPYMKITVTELCERAEINRATFYKHYQDVPQLFEKIEESFFEMVREKFTGVLTDVKSFIVDILNYSRDNMMHLSALSSENGDPNFLQKLYAMCFDLAYSIFEGGLPKGSDTERKMLFNFISQGCIGIMVSWMQNGSKEPPEEVAALVLRLTDAAIAGYSA